jgi:hypothetical protein
MKIEFDEFEITIKPKAKGASLMSMLSELFKTDVVAGLLMRLGDIAEVTAIAQMPDEEGEIIGFFNDLGVILSDSITIDADNKRFMKLQSDRPDDWKTFTQMVLEKGVGESIEWLRGIYAESPKTTIARINELVKYIYGLNQAADNLTNE